MDRPKKVKFRDALDTKIAFVSAGSKHTLAIDAHGKLWYFGNKLSVGIRAPRSKLQFEPIPLTAEVHTPESAIFEHGFVFVDANSMNNIAITASDNSVYCFGQRFSERNSDEELQDEYQSDDENALNDSAEGMDLGITEHHT